MARLLHPSKSFICAFIFAALFCLTHCIGDIAVVDVKLDPHPDYPGKCYWEAKHLVLNMGEIYRVPTRCVLVECLEDFSVRVKDCSPFYNVSDETCYIVERDYSLVFPQCCMQYMCPDVNGNFVRV